MTAAILVLGIVAITIKRWEHLFVVYRIIDSGLRSFLFLILCSARCLQFLVSMIMICTLPLVILFRLTLQPFSLSICKLIILKSINLSFITGIHHGRYRADFVLCFDRGKSTAQKNRGKNFMRLLLQETLIIVNYAILRPLQGVGDKDWRIIRFAHDPLWVTVQRKCPASACDEMLL